MPRHDANFDFFRGNQPWAIGTQQQRILATSGNAGTHFVTHFKHVAYRNAFGNTNCQIEFRLDCFPNSRSCPRRRDINHRHGRTGLDGSLLDRSEDRYAENRLTRFFWIDAGDKALLAIGIFLALFSVKLTGLAGNALGNYFGVFIYQNAHLDSLATIELQPRPSAPLRPSCRH